MSKKANDALRAKYTALVTELLKTSEDVMAVSANQIAFPCVDEEGNDSWIEITIKVPTGSRDGDVYDGYSLAEDYQMKTEAKAVKAKEAAAKKAAKIARDEKMREQKAAAKAAHEAKINEKGEG